MKSKEKAADQGKKNLSTTVISLKTLIKYALDKLFLNLYSKLPTDHQQPHENDLSDTVYQYLPRVIDFCNYYPH